MAYRSDAIIHAIEFDPSGGFVIHYSERADLSPFGSIDRRLTVAGGIPGTENLPVAETIDAAKELLDLALVNRYNDPQEIRSNLR